ncbi:MAG: ADP-ribosylglycohydrolase family protein [Actinomycetaceae bacterium]|nr:ADP-ribosylglycohydrolase family protein [Actinomycetaceae bacterium]
MDATLSRIAGALYGQALGDAMGMPSELWPVSRIREFFGDFSNGSGIRGFLPGPNENPAAKGFKAGQFTDDTSQALCVAQAIISEGGVPKAETVARNLIDWAESIHAFDGNILGPSSKAALMALRDGKNVEELENLGTTNGAVMRISPVACAFIPGTKTLVDAIYAACAPTHKSDAALEGAGIVSGFISALVEGVEHVAAFEVGLGLGFVCRPLGKDTYSASPWMRANTLVEETGNAPLIEAMGLAYTYFGAGMETSETVPSAVVLAFASNFDPLTCAIACANLGGDTDTIGAIATAICGAASGVDSIDKDLRNTLDSVNNVDLMAIAQDLATIRDAQRKAHA